MRPVLIALVGPPASGKSTLAARLAARLPAVVVQSDAVRKALVPAPRYTAEEHQQVFAAAHAKAASLLRAGQHVVFDATSLQAASRCALAEIATASGARLLVARLAISAAAARARLARRAAARAPGDLSDADWAVYLMLAARFEPIRQPHWVLNGAVDADALAALLARAVGPRPAPPAGSPGGNSYAGRDEECPSEAWS
ncbi:MAG TPA: AAA family ATPase [Chloroflexota bacterium]|nr:AAA family ATPase [Chloroflexota bacterium]